MISYKKILILFVAIAITLLTSAIQKRTSPISPFRGSFEIDKVKIDYLFLRSHGENNSQIVKINLEPLVNSGVPLNLISAKLYSRRYKIDKAWNQQNMLYQNNHLIGKIPQQPPAGKIEYYLTINYNNQEHVIPQNSTVVVRFRGPVSWFFLAPHIFFMLLALVLSNVVLLVLPFKGPHGIIKYANSSLIFLILGGFIFGPIVQKYSFGEYWTGFPFGYDLTDNKTLVSLIFWILAVSYYYLRKKSLILKRAKVLFLLAAVVNLIIFTIPHSLLGSELDYNKETKEK